MGAGVREAPRIRQLGPIRVLAKLGHGGMGAVYAGFDLDTKAFVAAKTIFSELAEDEKARRRFDQEARVYERLKHPNIVAFAGTGMGDDGTPYIALEYVKGTSLRSLMDREKRLPPGDVLEIMEDVSKALDLAHSLQIIHRDIKPQNIIINQDGILKLLDFGIARLDNSSGVGTTTGQVVGTYSYAPPEQNQGKDIDFSADLYSLGIMAWEMLVGRRAYSGANPMEIVLQQTKGPPVPASFMVPGLPEGFDAVLQKVCQPLPENRFRTAAEVGAALRQVRRNLAGRGSSSALFGDEVHEKWVLAKNAFNNRQFSLALSLAKYIVGRRDSFAPAHFLLGKLYAEKGLPFNATDSFRRALELQPDNADYVLDFAVALYRLEMYAQAHREVLRLLEREPNHRIAIGFEAIVRERIEEVKRAELDKGGEDLEAPLWFEGQDPGSADTAPPRPPEAPGDPGALARAAAAGGADRLEKRPGTPATVRVEGPAVDPEWPRTLSSFMPGLGQWYLGARLQGLGLMGAAALASAAVALGLVWSPPGALESGARLLLLAGGFWAASFLWRQAPRRAEELARLVNLRGRVERNLGTQEVEIGIGLDRGVRIGQAFEVFRSAAGPGGGEEALVLGELKIEAVGPASARGLFLPARSASDLPAPGDRVRWVRG